MNIIAYMICAYQFTMWTYTCQYTYTFKEAQVAKVQKTWLRKEMPFVLRLGDCAAPGVPQRPVSWNRHIFVLRNCPTLPVTPPLTGGFEEKCNTSVASFPDFDEVTGHRTYNPPQGANKSHWSKPQRLASTNVGQQTQRGWLFTLSGWFATDNKPPNSNTGNTHK